METQILDDFLNKPALEYPTYEVLVMQYNSFSYRLSFSKCEM